MISEKGLHGRIIQDVITRPSKKFARVQFENGFVEWYCAQTHLDEVHFSNKNGIVEVLKIPKSRPDDFILELKHIDIKIKSQKIDLSHGIETLAVKHQLNQILIKRKKLLIIIFNGLID